MASGCAGTPTSPLQRQAIETHYIDGDYPSIFRATRTAFQNEGFMIEQSEYASGFLHFSGLVRDKRPGLALGLGILPGGGSFYTGNWLLGVADVVLWPFSVLWDGPVAAFMASRSRREVRVTVTFVDLGERSEIRTGFRREQLDGDYAMRLRRLYAEIQRQLMLRRYRDDVLGSTPPAQASP